jgi:excisionase family DNA binding protein
MASVGHPGGGSPKYLTVEQVAHRFSLNVTTVYRLAKRGGIPSFKVGNQWRFSEERLDAWVMDRECGFLKGVPGDTRRVS